MCFVFLTALRCQSNVHMEPFFIVSFTAERDHEHGCMKFPMCLNKLLLKNCTYTQRWGAVTDYYPEVE